jgi:hypothetical protein
MYVASVLSRCCKSRSGCYIYMHATNIRFKFFSDVFASVSGAHFKCFICLLLYVAIVASKCLKSRLMLHMGCAWEAANGASDGCGSIGDVRSDVDNVQDSAGPSALACESNVLDARSLPMRTPSGRWQVREV